MNNEITNHSAARCPDCFSIECCKDELAAFDDEEGRLAWLDAVGTCNSIELRRRRWQFVDLREAIAAWPEQKHQPSLTGWDGCPAVVGHPCTCGADEKNAKRKKARKLAGLEDA